MLKSFFYLCAFALCFHAVVLCPSGAAESASTTTERALISARWTVTTEVGQRAWGNIIFREGHEFMTMNGPQGAWKMTGPRTVDLGGRYVIEFSPGLERFVVTGTDGAKIATGARKGEDLPVAQIIGTAPPVMRTVPDPLNLTPPKTVPEQLLKIPLPPENPPPQVTTTPARPPVRAPVEAPTAVSPAKKKVPVGVPADATFFHGKWYRMYVESLPWRNARDRCKVLGGLLACVHDQPTQDLMNKLADGQSVWLGATDEDTEGVWRWADGKAMTYSPDGQFHPVADRKLNWLAMGDGRWAALPIRSSDVLGFICEWKDW